MIVICHYHDVIMRTLASQITASIVHCSVCWGADQRCCFSPIWILRWPFKSIKMLWRNNKKCLMPHIWYSSSPVWKWWWIFTSSMWVTHYIKMVFLHCGCQYACYYLPSQKTAHTLYGFSPLWIRRWLLICLEKLEHITCQWYIFSSLEDECSRNSH